MPIPKPNKGESKDDFMTRCMGNEIMTSEYHDEKQRAAVCNSQMKNFEMETVDLDNVEIFSTGIWEGKGSAKGGDHITEDYLDLLVKTFQTVGDKVKPRMILTHNGKKSEDVTGMAAVGWIQNLRRDGSKLLADIKKVPKKIAGLIDAKAFGRFSPGIWNNMNINGEIHSNVLDHLALLGADLPANLDIDGFIDLYENKITGDIIIYEVQRMDTAIVQDLENKIKEFEMKTVESDKEKTALEKENAELKIQVKKIEFEKKDSEITAYLDGQIKDGKITPVEAEGYKKLMLGETIEDAGEVKQFSARVDIVKNIIANKINIPMGQQSQHIPVEKEFAKEKIDDGSDLDAKAREYMKEYNTDYRTALLIVAQEVK